MSIPLFRLAVAAAALFAAPAQALDFKPYGAGDFAKLVKAHAGRPLALHYWSVTCPPCLAELPAWEKIAQRKDVDVVFINVDEEEERARAEARLKKAGLTAAAHYGFADSFVDRLYFEADKGWRGELPFTALVKPDGGVTGVTGEMDDAALTKWLAPRGG